MSAFSFLHDPNTSSAALRKRKTLKKATNFSLMVVGESGLGRSTLINTLCGGNTIVQPSLTASQDLLDRSLTLRHENVELEDNDGHKISLNIIDTPNFALSLDSDADFRTVVDFIRHQYDEVLLEESRVRRNPRFKDGRIHALIYMIHATGHGLSDIDIHFLQHISGLVNILPVIAKADALSPEELVLNKRLILEDLDAFKIAYYKFNEYEHEQDYIDDEIIEYNRHLNSLVPFSIIGANQIREPAPDSDEEETVKLRVLGPANNTPINVEDPALCDFTVLKNVLLITHLTEFKELTHDVIYENYRTRELSGKLFQYVHGDTAAAAKALNTSLATDSIHLGDGVDGADTVRAGKDEDANASASADEGYLAKEEQIRLEEERLRKFEERVHQDLLAKRQELMERESELREIEKRLLEEEVLKKMEAS